MTIDHQPQQGGHKHPEPVPDLGTTCCCAPGGHGAEGAPSTAPIALGDRFTRSIPDRFVPMPGGRALVGTRTPLLVVDGESPLREVPVGRLAIDPFAVTNAWFAEFVDDTGYVTEAERFGWSFVFHAFVPAAIGPTEGVPGVPWWRRVDGADWRRPEGPGSDLAKRGNHPVVQVSLADARTFAAWAGGRLPQEAEWEHAARGGLGDVRYPWGDRAPDDDTFMPCNIWQGEFPRRNTGADGWLSTCPVDAFEPNAYGLYNMCGNVWEWCDQPLRARSAGTQLPAGDQGGVQHELMLTKGGSHLCHASYCHRYRIAARNGNTADSATGHIGFRIVFDLD